MNRYGAKNPAEQAILDRFSIALGGEEELKAVKVLAFDYQTMATILLGDLPESRERSLALTALEESLMWAFQALATASRNKDGG